MASYDGTILINTKVDTSGISKGASTIESQLEGLSGSFSKLGKVAIATFAAKKLIDFGKQAIKLASDLEEVQNVVEVAFGSMQRKMEDFADTALKTYGISELTAKKTASVYMSMGRSMGLTMDVASDMALELTALSADMASFYNISQERADIALKAVYTGETEVLKQYGIVMTEVNLKQFAMEQGITKSLNAMTQQEKTMLRYRYVMQQTSLAQGDFARTSGSWANQTKLLSENWKEFMTIVGSALKTILLPLVKILNSIVEGLVNIANFIKEAVGAEEESYGAIEDMTDAQDDYTDAVLGTDKALKKELASFDTIEKLFDSTISGGGSGSGGLFDFGALDKINGGSEEEKEEKKKVLLIWEWEPTIPTALDVVTNLAWRWLPERVRLPEFEPLPVPVYKPVWGLKNTLQEEMQPLVQIFEELLPKLPNPVFEPTWGLVPVFQEELNTLQENLANWAPVFAYNWAELLNNMNLNTIRACNAILQNYKSFYELMYGNQKEWIISMADATKTWLENWVDNGAKAVQTYATNFISGLQSMWENFKEWASAVGKTISKTFTSKSFTRVVLGAGMGLMAVGGVLGALPTLGASLSATAAGLTGLAGLVPALANGAVIPPNKEFLAVLGDQRSGLNIETPLETMLQAFRQANAETDRELSANININLNGETLYSELQRISARRGTKLVTGGAL